MDNVPLNENQPRSNVHLQHILGISNPTTSTTSSVTPIRNANQPSTMLPRGSGTVTIDIPEDQFIHGTSNQEEDHSLQQVVVESQLYSTSTDKTTELNLAHSEVITIEESSYKNEIAIQEATQEPSGKNEMTPNQPLKESVSTAIEVWKNTSHDVSFEPDSTKSEIPRHSGLNAKAISTGSLLVSPQGSSTTILTNKVDEEDDITDETTAYKKLPDSSSSIASNDSSGSSISLNEASRAVMVTIEGGNQA